MSDTPNTTAEPTDIIATLAHAYEQGEIGPGQLLRELAPIYRSTEAVIAFHTTRKEAMRELMEKVVTKHGNTSVPGWADLTMRSGAVKHSYNTDGLDALLREWRQNGGAYDQLAKEVEAHRKTTTGNPSLAVTKPKSK